MKNNWGDSYLFSCFFLKNVLTVHELKMKLVPEDGLQKLVDSGELFVELFRHGTLSIEVYMPPKIDEQKPHDRDEIYIIISGHGDFFSGNEVHRFRTGDLFFVPAGEPHHFEHFSEDFATWVIFYGPQGGEKD